MISRGILSPEFGQTFAYGDLVESKQRKTKRGFCLNPRCCKPDETDLGYYIGVKFYHGVWSTDKRSLDYCKRCKHALMWCDDYRESDVFKAARESERRYRERMNIDEAYRETLNFLSFKLLPKDVARKKRKAVVEL